MSEDDVIAEALRRYDALGWRLFRNNVGVLPNTRGVPIRFGLANTSKAVNERIKSSDYIGWRPRLVTPDMIGDVVAQFASVEFKHGNWTPAPPTDRARHAHEQAQGRWHDMVRRDGGLAGFDSGSGF